MARSGCRPSVAAGWAPYHDGHWAWIAPWGWTWVDDAPWGFAPYHYGRWASFGGRWGWIPGPYGVTPIYAPALVGWIGGGRGGSGFSLSFSIGTAAAVGWFPLGPREPYFPSYQVEPGLLHAGEQHQHGDQQHHHQQLLQHSRNSNNTAIATSVREPERVQNGVTAVPQNTFASGRRVNQYARAVPAAQLASVQVVAAPAIAPQRASVLGPRADTASRAAASSGQRVEPARGGANPSSSGPGSVRPAAGGAGSESRSPASANRGPADAPECAGSGAHRFASWTWAG